MDGNSAAALPVVLLTVLSISSAFLQPYDLLYDNAVQAFSQSDYGSVVRHMEAALSSFSELRRTKVRCRLRCQDQHQFESNFTDLGFFYGVLRRAACMNPCIEEKLGAQSLHKVSEDVLQDFNRRIPYNYLQMAYQKLKVPDKAAAAAHTYFQANPEHVEMGQNLEQYKDRQDVRPEHFVDREARLHQLYFTDAVKLYDKGDYGAAIILFEDALVEYFQADVECRALCQGPQKFESHDHIRYRYSLHELVSDHFTQVLHCEHECVRDLATRPGRLSPMENYLPLHYDYLQFAYYQMDRLEEALQCALTYLLFHEGQEFMTENVDYFREMLERDGKPREEAARYLRRHKQELELLLMGSEIMGVEFTEGNYWSSTGGRHDSRIPSGTDGGMEYVPISDKRMSLQLLCKRGPLVYDSVRLVQNSAALNGSQRVLLDSVISEDECSELRRLAHSVTMAGDGYRGRMSPHTPNEKFEGATVLKTLQYGYEGRVPLRSARLFYEVSERARRIIESYFMLNSTLHFSYTHLVCRTAITGDHPIHADNCLLDPEANECWKEPPAYTYRDYSALLYLNGDFSGGEFIFTEMDAKTVTATVKPKCGRMVGFSSGGENPHGVKAVTSGQRCAVALWFTMDPLFRELERLQADEVIQALDTQSVWTHSLHINPKDEL
uniref:procollagen-proline 3-dioxygenase n=1 Tax=Neogobius melanostomus TaxID=47308 RepID=A0A8C6WSY6_9GOBI